MTINCGGNVTLRSISDSDTEKVLQWRNSEQVRQYFNYQEEITEVEHRRWLETKVYKGLVQQFIIHDDSSNKDVGSVYLKDIDAVNRKAEYGIFIGEGEATGRGLGTTVAKAIIDYAFNTLHLQRVYLQVHQDNPRAIRSYEKAGFRKETVLKDEVFVNGKYCDLVIMGIENDQRSI